MNIESLKKFIESRLFYTMDIFTYEQCEVNNISFDKLILKHSHLPCFISYKNKNESFKNNDTHMSFSYKCKLFYTVDVDIAPSSIIKVNILNEVIEFIVITEPSLYPTHKEVLVERRRLC